MVIGLVPVDLPPTATKMTSLTNWFGPKVLTAAEVVNGVGLKLGRLTGTITQVLGYVAEWMRPAEV